MTQVPFESDDALDARLRDVAVPDDLVARLRRIPSSGRSEKLAEASLDAQLDQQLQDVVVREDFLRRLREIPARAKKRRKLAVAQPLEEALLEEALCEVPVPRGFTARLRQIAGGPRVTSTARWATPWGLAAALLILAAVAGLGVVIGRATMGTGASARLVPVEPSLDVAFADEDIQRLEPLLPGEPSADDIETALPDVLPELARIPSEQDASVGEPQAPLLSRWQREVLMLDAERARQGVFAIDRSFDEQPELLMVPGLRPRGIDPPSDLRFDLFFLRRYGIHPFVSPGWLPELTVPLGVRPESYELTRACLSMGQLPPAEAVRTEEFLAAPDYRDRWPQRPGEAAVRILTAAGPAPLARTENLLPLAPPMHLLHVGVHGAELPVAARPPADVTVAVDLSASMRWGGRLDMVRAALHALVDGMQPADQLSIVAFSAQAWTVVEHVPQSRAGELHEAVDKLYARTSTNVGAGLDLARLTSDEGAARSKAVRHVVLLSDGLSQLDAVSYDILRERFRRRGSDDVRLTLVALGLEHVADAQWSALAAETGGRFVRAATAAEIGWALHESILERSAVVARAVTLRVTFDPEQVESYRLFGHESSPVAGLMPVAGEVDLRSGQTGVALFELKLREPTGRGAGKRAEGEDNTSRSLSRQQAALGDVARITVEWRNPSNGVIERAAQSIKRRQFAPTFAESAPALQRATLAAGAAEILRGSYFARGLKMADVAALAEQLPPAVAAQPDVEQLVALLRAATRLQQGGR